MNTPRPLLLTTIGFLVWGVLVLITVLLTEDRTTWLLRQGPGSTASAGPRGLSRLYRALRQVEVPVQRVRDRGFITSDTTLVVVDPPEAATRDLAHDIDQALRYDELTLVVAGTRRQILQVCPALGAGGVPDQMSADHATVTSPLAYSGQRLATLHGVIAFDSVPPGDVVIAEAPGSRPVILMRTIGNGRVIYCSEPGLFSNLGIDLSDNARVVLSLCCGRRSVTFDDRWVMRGANEAGDADMMSILYGTEIGRGVVTLVLTAGLILFLRGITPGGPREAEKSKLRPTSYVDALAEATLAARKGGFALGHFQDTFRRTAARRLGLPPDATPETLAAPLAARSGDDARKIVRLLRHRPPDRAVAEAVRELDGLRRRTGI